MNSTQLGMGQGEPGGPRPAPLGPSAGGESQQVRLQGPSRVLAGTAPPAEHVGRWEARRGARGRAGPVSWDSAPHGASWGLCV